MNATDREIMRVRFRFLGSDRPDEVTSFVMDDLPAPEMLSRMRDCAQRWADQEGCPVTGEIIQAAKGTHIKAFLDALGYKPFQVLVQPTGTPALV